MVIICHMEDLLLGGLHLLLSHLEECGLHCMQGCRAKTWLLDEQSLAPKCSPFAIK